MRTESEDTTGEATKEEIIYAMLYANENRSMKCLLRCEHVKHNYSFSKPNI